jgi:hypothetical protein
MEYLSIFVKSEARTTEQSFMPIAGIKEEPELNIDNEWIFQNDSTKICDAEVANEKELIFEAVPYQIIFHMK